MNRKIHEKRDGNRAPLRTFSDGPEVHDSRSLARQSSQIWHFAWPLLIFALIALSGILATRAYYKAEKTVSSDSMPEFYSEAGTILTEPFLRTYELARGYQGYLRQPRSIDFMGTYAKDNTLATMRGEMDLNGSGTMYLEFGLNDISIEFKEGRIQDGQGAIMSDEISAVCAFVDATVDPLLKVLQAGDYSRLNIVESNILGRSVYVAELSGVGVEMERIVYLNKQTLMPIEQINYLHSAGAQKYRYYDYMNVGGMRLSGDILWSPPDGKVVPIKLNKLAMK